MKGQFSVLGWRLVLCLLTLPALSSGAETGRATNTVGFASFYGDLQFSGHLGSIKLSGDETFYLFYNYSSYEGTFSPHLGRGFWVPMMESQFIDHDYYVEFTTLGGERLFAYRIARDPTLYYSLDGKQEVRRRGDNTFIRRSKDGFTLEYRQGRLQRFQTPKGAEVTVEYSGDQCTGLRSGTGYVLSFKDESDREKTIITHLGKFRITMQGYPVPQDTQQGEADPSLLAERTVDSIHWPNDSETRFIYEEGKKDGQQQMHMVYGDSSLSFVWDQRTGFLQQVNDIRYGVSPIGRRFHNTAEHAELGTFGVNRMYPDGSWKSYIQNQDLGIIMEESSDEPLTVTHLILDRGPTYYLVKKKERLVYKRDSREKSFDTIYRAFYNTDAEIIREVVEGTLTHHIRPGMPIDESQISTEDDYIRYDRQGRPIQRRRDGSLTQIEYYGDLRREASKFAWGEVLIQYFHNNGTPAPIPPSEKFSELSDL